MKDIHVEEIGDTECVIVQQSVETECDVATLVLRGSTDSILDDIEHAVDNAVNNYRLICKDSRLLPGGGATEIELGRILSDFGRKQTGLDQYAIAKYAEALEIVPRMLAETSGFDATDLVSAVQAMHSGGEALIGVDVQSGSPKDLTKEGIFDLYQTKWWILKLATEAVITVLKVLALKLQNERNCRWIKSLSLVKRAVPNREVNKADGMTKIRFLDIVKRSL